MIDVQEGVVDGAHARDEVVATIASLVARARAEGVAVVWVQHQSEGLVAGSEPWQIVAELAPADGEPVVHKQYPDAFEATDLEAVLAERGVAREVVSGAQTEQ